MIKLNIENKVIVINTHNINDKVLYKAQDLLVGYGFDVQKTKDTIQNWKDKVSKKCGVKFTPYSIQRGKQSGTYLNKRNILKLAGYVSYEFEDAVYEAFEELIIGNTEKALDIAASFVVTPELVTQINRQSEAVNAAIAIWDSKQEKPRGPRAYICIWSHITAKCVTGGSLESIKKAHGVTSLADYFIKTKHKEGIGAYLAITNMLVPLLKAGVDYYVIQDTFTSVLNQ